MESGEERGGPWRSARGVSECQDVLPVCWQNSLTAVEHVKLEASAAEEQNLLYEQSDLRIEVVELTRLAAIKVSEHAQ